ncbi:MAG: OB-fold nucleic acid binding domain-containing protein [Nitrososphaerota archaeon]|nr:OB-fold nucleic acid binding domain-containing protein [Candidatus Bathyarchaeota archaeon]MDW8049372.1 OB-fold nucleic acid binding domain-containing protein [Nitrososphaerota archaeon]
MSIEEIICRIISSRPELTREEVINMIEEKIGRSKGFLTAEAAARLIAAEIGADHPRLEFEGDMPIGSLVSGLGDVTVSGRVIAVCPLQKFLKPDEAEGKFRQLLVADKSGEARVILWNENAELQDPVGLIGKIVRFTHGYVRIGLDGMLEINIASRGKIEVQPPSLCEKDFPPLAKFIKKISDISGDERMVNTIGLVGQIYPASAFKREDGSEGKVRRIELKDDEANIMLVLWNDKVEELAFIETGEYIQIMGARVKDSIGGRPELHADRSTDIIALKKKPQELLY